jgi:hypothetical protein
MEEIHMLSNMLKACFRDSDPLGIVPMPGPFWKVNIHLVGL